MRARGGASQQQPPDLTDSVLPDTVILLLLPCSIAGAVAKADGDADAAPDRLE